LWHYSGHNPTTWFSSKTGLRIIDVESNAQTEQSNDQTEHQLERQEQHSNAEASPSQLAIETESDTEYISPELIQHNYSSSQTESVFLATPRSIWASFLSHLGLMALKGGQ